ncbi:hypothetical protein BDN71DRAFT_1451683 [Pleurotus eryngii]|uniref:Uncharacterized protein n=1 Tax=Pleurotus eryngii TaxID=5323 RepID=A0A9P5ZTZ0_PLEER|nr:hypothetical protein BDN71DRAFT_1451683 [Pleurotus eryngii]
MSCVEGRADCVARGAQVYMIHCVSVKEGRIRDGGRTPGESEETRERGRRRGARASRSDLRGSSLPPPESSSTVKDLYTVLASQSPPPYLLPRRFYSKPVLLTVDTVTVDFRATSRPASQTQCLMCTPRCTSCSCTSRSSAPPVRLSPLLCPLLCSCLTLEGRSWIRAARRPDAQMLRSLILSRSQLRVRRTSGARRASRNPRCLNTQYQFSTSNSPDTLSLIDDS